MANEITITSGGRERVPQATELLSDAFSTDPTMIYLLSSFDAAQREAYRPKFFKALLTAAAINEGAFEEVNEWQSCCVVLPPGRTIDGLWTQFQAGLFSVAWAIGIGGCERLLREFAPLTKGMKAKALKPNEKYYYIFFIGTPKARRGNGYCTAFVKQHQAIARREGMPIYLEAATEYSWELYKKLGFITVDVIILGKGKAAADGTTCQGGPGVRLWGMVWRPEDIPDDQ